VRRIETQARQAIQETADRRLDFEAREVHADADMRSVREGEVVASAVAVNVKAGWVIEEGGITVGAGDREVTSSP
jgi:transposase-like protein